MLSGGCAHCAQCNLYVTCFYKCRFAKQSLPPNLLLEIWPYLYDVIPRIKFFVSVAATQNINAVRSTNKQKHVRETLTKNANQLIKKEVGFGFKKWDIVYIARTKGSMWYLELLWSVELL
eukprot:GEMP01121488.1.p1 GENE.GEMP01121488.1~~GEMP01121488.1.p1  ORF type:complete len:120 (-),score=0.75 GEMP01121488.1:109-468(-)